MNDEEIKVSELDSVSEIRDTDQIMIVQGGANKKISGSYINEHGVTVSSITPDTSQRVWFKQSKNLFSSTLELGTYSNEGVKSTSTTNYRNATPIQVQPNTTYTFSINGVSQKYGIYYYNNTNTFINSEGLTTGTFTTPANCYYINFRCFNADFTSDYANLKIQLEQGSTATSYVDYITPQIIVNNREIYTKDNQEIYSTNEIKIGTWLGKPLYRKVIDFGALPNATAKSVAHGISNIDKITKIEGITYSNQNYSPLPLVYNSNEAQFNTEIYVGYANIFMKTTQNRSSVTAYVTLEYTKTTD